VDSVSRCHSAGKLFQVSGPEIAKFSVRDRPVITAVSPTCENVK